MIARLRCVHLITAKAAKRAMTCATPSPRQGPQAAARALPAYVSMRASHMSAGSFHQSRCPVEREPVVARWAGRQFLCQRDGRLLGWKGAVWGRAGCRTLFASPARSTASLKFKLTTGSSATTSLCPLQETGTGSCSVVAGDDCSQGRFARCCTFTPSKRCTWQGILRVLLLEFKSSHSWITKYTTCSW